MKTGKTILVVEDEADLVDLLRYNLEREGYACRWARDGDAALAEVRRASPDLIVLDRMLPGVSGDQVVSRLKGDPQTAAIPVVMLTAKAEELDELVGLGLGADDYITKPFSMKRLLARIAAILRRAEPVSPALEVVSEGPVRLDRGRFEVTVEGTPVALTATEFRILQALMAARGRVLDRSRLIDVAMGPDVAVTDRVIDVHVTALRRKLGLAGRWLQTIRGVGYTFRQPE